MSLRSIGLACLAATALSGVARADDYYRCGERLCYDDQADETRRLNEMQLDDPGAGMRAVPPPDAGEYDPYTNDDGASDPYDDRADADKDMKGQGGPYDPDEEYGPVPGDDGYDAPDDGGAADPYDPDEANPYDDRDPDDVDEDGCDPDACDPDEAPYPDAD